MAEYIRTPVNPFLTDILQRLEKVLNISIL